MSDEFDDLEERLQEARRNAEVVRAIERRWVVRAIVRGTYAAADDLLEDLNIPPGWRGLIIAAAGNAVSGFLSRRCSRRE